MVWLITFFSLHRLQSWALVYILALSLHFKGYIMNTEKMNKLVTMFTDRCMMFELVYEMDSELLAEMQAAYHANDWDRIAYILDNHF